MKITVSSPTAISPATSSPSTQPGNSSAARPASVRNTPVQGAAAPPSPSKFSLDQAKAFVRALALGTTGSAATTAAAQIDLGPESRCSDSSYVYHVVDTRNDDALVQQAVISFEVPEVSLGPKIEAGNGKSYRGTSDFYLSHSVPGNMFTGVMNIKSGQVDLFPLAPDRLDMIDTSWGQKAYAGPIHDGSQSLIEHPGQGGSGAVSHMQLVAKLADKNPDNYVGFTVLDVRGLRRSGAEWNIVNDAVSMLYGASRSLNTRHVKLIDEIPNNSSSNVEAFNHSKGSIGFHLPVEVKRHILTGIADKLGSDHTWSATIRTEMNREELAPNAYEIALAKKAAATSAPRLYI